MGFLHRGQRTPRNPTVNCSMHIRMPTVQRLRSTHACTLHGALTQLGEYGVAMTVQQAAMLLLPLR